MSTPMSDAERLAAFRQELSGGFSVQSGVFAAVNEKVVTSVNAYGQYEAKIPSESLTDDELLALSRVSAMSPGSHDESQIADSLFSGVEGIRHDRLLGFHSHLYAGHVTDEAERAASSSGGLATWILVQLLKEGHIDGVIHVRPEENGSRGTLFQYAVSTTVEEIRAGAKSRYYPADLSESLKKARRAGTRYAVTGIPSFITELRLLAEENADFAEVIRFTVGLICGHQKSMKYAEAIAWERGIAPGHLRSVDFRKKVEGFPADEYVTEIAGDVDGMEQRFLCRAHEVFVSSWSHGFFKSTFSDYSDDLFNETADVALGDAWLPAYSQDYRGTNLVIVRNPVIAQLIQEGVAGGALWLEPLTAEDAVRSQPGLVRHAHDELPYRLNRMDGRNRWRPNTRSSASAELAPVRRRIQDLREQIAQESHTHYARAVELNDWTYFERRMKPLVDRHNALYTLTDVRRILRRGPLFLIRRALTELRRRLR